MKVSGRRLEKSQALWDRARNIVPAGTQTLSKGPTQYVQGVAPIYLERGQGSHVYDVDGNEYIDYPLALGPVLLGHAYPRIVEAVTKQLRRGTTFSLMHPLEVEVAELLVEHIPCAEMVRYGKNGSDVTSAAVRLARAYTGREKIASCGYHGWQDWSIGATERNSGVPGAVRSLTLKFEYNNVASLERLFAEHHKEIAAVIIEAVGIVEPEDGFLGKVKELTHRNEAILIFDEIINGFRVALGGIQELYDITPDLATFGKAMANGLPLSAVVGRREVMKEFERVFFSFTFGGETLSLAAAAETIREIQEKNVIDFIWKQASKLKDGFNDIAVRLRVSDIAECVGLAPHHAIIFRGQDEEESLSLKSLFQQEVIKRGVLFQGVNFTSFSHTDEDIEETLLAYEEALATVKDAMAKERVDEMLEGEKIRPVFRKP